ncbi:MAG: hypothetical protein QXX35_00785 [Desulfurococcaceae archaeon]
MSDSSSEWWRMVDASNLDEDSRYRFLYYLVEKYVSSKVLEEVGISRVTLWMLLRQKSLVS